MYQIRQFKPALYFLVLLGIAGFALAAESLPLWVLGTLTIVLNAMLVHQGRFRPMPRLISNIITISAVLYVIHEISSSGTTAVIMIGQFLMLLQIVKLWEQRGNRDYAQLLVLSLLLMVAAAISTASMIFGIMLVIYLFLSLYCCLLFHLKIEADAASATMTAQAPKPGPTMVRQDERRLSRSMRRFTSVVSAVGIVFAVVVFVFFPRGAGAGMLGPMQFKASQSLVGFSDEVSFQNIARIQQNPTPIARVSLVHNGQPVHGEVPLLLRGVTLDTYAGKQGGWRWVRWQAPRDLFSSEFKDADAAAGETRVLDADEIHPLPPPPNAANRWEQSITLLPTGTDVLFSIAGPYSVKPAKRLAYRYWARTGEMRNIDLHPNGAVVYDVVSSNSLGNAPPVAGSGTDPNGPNIDKQIREYALRPEVSGSDAAGSLGLKRYQLFQRHEAPPALQPASTQPVQDLDEQIARNIERHLKSNFGYTLNLTDTRRIEGRDPLVAFLYDFKKGHCEYFAGAMTLMCQSLGMKARMCLGFHCDEFNASPGAGYYIVRQSHAHAWVEVLTQSGWKTFDPTSESDVAEQATHAGAWQKVRHFFDFLEYSYGNAVIAYTNEDRANLIQTAETAMLRATVRSSTRFDGFRKFLAEAGSSPGSYKAGVIMLTGMIALVAGAICIVIARFAWEKWRLRRRAARIGIGSLPDAEQLRLARQLQFYDKLLRLLDRHHIVRRPSQTQMEFSQSLLFLPAEAFETIRRLTDLFYRIRYGHVQLTPARQGRLDIVVEQLGGKLGQGPR